MDGIAYGLEGRRQEMCLDPSVSFLTHGSFTACPNRVLQAQRRYRDEVEWNPDVFYRQNLLPMYMERIDLVAEFMALNPKNLVLVPNVTTAINTVLKNLVFKEGDAILVYSYTYKSVQNICSTVAERAGATVIRVEIPVRIDSQEDVVRRYTACINTHHNIKIAIIDYISSPTATLFPVKELIGVCKSRDILTLVDAAHVPGHHDVCMEDLGADFITGNLHKWVFTPKSCALLWVSPAHHDVIRPLMTSAVHQHEDFRRDFVYSGTLDYTAMLCVKEGIQMHRDLGGFPQLSAYTSALLKRAVALLTSKWGTEKYPIPADMEAPNMRSVLLPSLKQFPLPNTGNFAFADYLGPTLELANRFNVVCGCQVARGVAFVRVCAQFYNTIEEYQALADAILTLKQEGDNMCASK